MLYVIWGILVLPVIIVGMILHFKIKEWGKPAGRGKIKKKLTTPS